MSTYDERRHPRGGDPANPGRFSHKTHAESDIRLADTQASQSGKTDEATRRHKQRAALQKQIADAEAQLTDLDRWAAAADPNDTWSYRRPREQAVSRVNALQHRLALLSQSTSSTGNGDSGTAS